MGLSNSDRNNQNPDVISAALIGVGHFGIAILAQALASTKARIAAIADRSEAAIQNALGKAGCERYAFCATRQEAEAAYRRGDLVATTEPSLLFSLPLQVVIEATGNPEAGADHALLAIENGKRGVMENKETDSCVGPILKAMAEEKGLIYTPVDGDQHGALIQLVAWAREIGLEVVCGGKSRDAEFIYDKDNRTVTVYADGVTIPKTVTVALTGEECATVESSGPQMLHELLARRKELLKDLDPRGGFDLCEMVIAANMTGLVPDISLLHDCILRTPEIPLALCGQADGGILRTEGAIEVVTNLHEKSEAGLGGGVFITVHCRNEYSQMILATKGCLSNPQGTVSLIYQPWHLCGVEAIHTILHMGHIAGGMEYRQQYDIVQEAAVDLRAGDLLGNDHDTKLLTHIMPAQPVAPDSRIPAHMLSGKKLLRDVPKGTILRYCDVDLPEDSTLLQLRRNATF